MSTVEERSYVEAARREKRAALEALGIRPFAYRYERSHTTREAIESYRDTMGEHGPSVTIAGRIVAWRPKGKVVFGHIEDQSGRIQVYFRQDELDELYEVVKLLDLD
ncbi:MAG TPA: OB-fold nucleic acid binding domain-containing protein, partial [Gemmatimonadales bacterium]